MYAFLSNTKMPNRVKVVLAYNQTAHMLTQTEDYDLVTHSLTMVTRGRKCGYDLSKKVK